MRDRTKEVDSSSIEEIKCDGSGVETFVSDMLDAMIEKGVQISTLDEIYRDYGSQFIEGEDRSTAGRTTRHSRKEFESYWNADDAGRQEFLKVTYSRRRADDDYATSKDMHVRELEIAAIRESLEDSGNVLDLGCGNGYTLISIGKELDGWELLGIDFSENLIEGSQKLLHRHRETMRSTPEFRCADAVEYLQSSADDSFDYVISERFIINLPSKDAQRRVVGEIGRVLRPGGRYLMCEGSLKGFNCLNDVREAVGLKKISENSLNNLMSIRIDDDEFERFCDADTNLRLISKKGFSEYFLMTRVLYPMNISPLVLR